MDDFYFSVSIDNNRTLYLAPMTDRQFDIAGQDVADRGGYFLFEKCGSGDFCSIEIIAHVLSEEAAFKLREAFSMD